MINNIKLGDFKVNPINILDNEKEITGCINCKFKDLCYMSQKDISIKNITKFSDIIGGEEDESN